MRFIGHRLPAVRLGRSHAGWCLSLAAIIVATSATPLALGASTPHQGATDLYLPDLQAELRAGASGLSLFGQEGLGAAQIDACNLSDGTNQMTLDLIPMSGTSPATLSRNVGPGATARFDLAGDASVIGGYYAGHLSGSGMLGGVARVRWVSGAVAAYEAAPAARDFILPLIARTVYSHTSIVYAQNADPNPNAITMTLYDPVDGGIMVETVCDTEGWETCSWDTAHAHMTFGPGMVGTNTPNGGWLGHAWFTAARPAAVMAYGDEMSAQGSSAYVGRPRSAASELQYLPLVRANYRGDSLIAIANADTDDVDVEIEYRGAADSPSGAGETIHQELEIPVRGAVYVDISERGRGSRPSPDLPRGSEPDGGFLGSAVIRASGPVLAVVQDEQYDAGEVDSISAYNGYGSADLGTEFSVPSMRKMLGYQSTSLIAFNPGYAPIDVTAELYDPGDASSGQVTAQIPAGGSARIALADGAQFTTGIGSARVRSTGPFAALVYDERDDRGEPLELRTTAYIRSINDSHVSGGAVLVEKGANVQVDLQISGTWPGATYTAHIAEGTCDGARASKHSLNEPVDGESATILRNVGLRDLTDTEHCIVVKSSGFPGRPARDVACGLIEPLPGPDVVDTALTWPVRLAAGGPIATPTVARSTATATVATDTPVQTATPSATPINVRSRLYLPVCYRH